MKPLINKTLSAIILATLFLTACRKDVNQQPANSAAYFELALSGLAVTTTPVQELQVVITAVNANNQAVYSNKKIKLTYKDGMYKSEMLSSAPGNYTLTGLVVENATQITTYAAPKAGSPKAIQVQQALPKQYNVQSASNAIVHVEVLPVAAREEASKFGYPNEAFNNPFTGALNAYTVKVKTAITVGQVLYDNLPATLILTGTKNDQSTVVTTIALIKTQYSYQQ